MYVGKLAIACHVGAWLRARLCGGGGGGGGGVCVCVCVGGIFFFCFGGPLFVAE